MQDSSASSPKASLAPPIFNDLLANVQRPLFAFVAGLVGDAEQARDIVQDVFCDAWRALQREAPPFDAALDGVAVRRWLFHAAYCDAASSLRRGSLITWEPLGAHDLSDAATPGHATRFEDAVAERQTLHAALATLRPEDVACLLLNTLQGFTAQEIGQIVGISADASKKRLSRAKRRLREAYITLDVEDEELRR